MMVTLNVADVRNKGFLVMGFKPNRLAQAAEYTKWLAGCWQPKLSLCVSICGNSPECVGVGRFYTRVAFQKHSKSAMHLCEENQKAESLDTLEVDCFRVASLYSLWCSNAHVIAGQGKTIAQCASKHTAVQYANGTHTL